MNTNIKNKDFYKKIAFLILVILLVLLLNNSSMLHWSSPEKIKEYVNSYGIFAPCIYIILFTLVPLTLFPDSILAISGGLIFGTMKGTCYTLIGAVLGASLSFYIARFLGKKLIDKLQNKNLYKLKNNIEKNGFIIILLLRCIPLFPFDIISYSAGLSTIKFKDFILATMVGTIPGIFVYVNIGDKSLNIRSMEFFISLIFLVLLILMSLVLKKKFINKVGN